MTSAHVGRDVAGVKVVAVGDGVVDGGGGPPGHHGRRGGVKFACKRQQTLDRTMTKCNTKATADNGPYDNKI